MSVNIISCIPGIEVPGEAKAISTFDLTGGTKQCPEEKVLRKEQVPKIIQTFGPTM